MGGEGILTIPRIQGSSEFLEESEWAPASRPSVCVSVCGCVGVSVCVCVCVCVCVAPSLKLNTKCLFWVGRTEQLPNATIAVLIVFFPAIFFKLFYEIFFAGGK